MIKYTIITLSCFMFLLNVYSYGRHEGHREPGKNPREHFVSLGDTGHKTVIGKDLVVTYDFDKKPSMGMVIVKIQVFNKKGDKVTSLKISGDSGMPSMKGAHDSGDLLFKLNKKGDYLMPVNIVMPGDWAIKVKFMKDNKVIFYGVINFDV